jgi:predicted  nucleic acid-binding Zn-ribbon protein
MGMGTATRMPRSLMVLQSVSCLGCGDVYAKPADGGTAAMNPGCPECGYLGWLPFTPEERTQRRRFALDRRPHLHA